MRHGCRGAQNPKLAIPNPENLWRPRRRLESPFKALNQIPTPETLKVPSLSTRPQYIKIIHIYTDIDNINIIIYIYIYTYMYIEYDNRIHYATKTG